MMIELTHKMLFEFILLFIFVVAAASYASYIFGSRVTRILEREASLKKQSETEFELTLLFDLQYEDMKNELESKISELEYSLVGVKTDAKLMAMDWVKSLPNDPWAHWNLAKAYDELEQYGKLKETLIYLLKTHPNFNIHIEEWLAETNAKLALEELGPPSATTFIPNA